MAGERGVTEWVAGFLFDDLGRVALVHKTHPAWQAGLMNGVGGHVETGETLHDAMRREFLEEAGLDVPQWHHFLSIHYAEGVAHFWRAWVDSETLASVRTMTEEPIRVVAVKDVVTGVHPVSPNLPWVVQLASYTEDKYEPITVRHVASGAYLGSSASGPP